MASGRTAHNSLHTSNHYDAVSDHSFRNMDGFLSDDGILHE